MSASISLGGYRLATWLATPLAGPLLSLRLNRGKEDPMRLDERRGLFTRARPEGSLVWLHGASVGEALSLLPLIERLTQEGRQALITTGTVTSARLMERRLPAGAFHQFAPLDAPRFMRRFFAYWRPDLGLIAESEIWPNMIVEAAKTGAPLVMVNARMSLRSFARWRRAKKFIAALLERFELILAQSFDDAERLEALGAPEVQVTGNLKYDAPAPPADHRELAELSGLISGRRIWVAASTHDGEERAAAEAHANIVRRFPDALTLIAPRHPARGEAIEAFLRAEGFRTALRSRGERPEADVEIYVCDTMGELGLFYRLAGVVFLGKSLTGKGGSAILHGPNVGNFADVYEGLDAAGGALVTRDADELAGALIELFADPGRLRAMTRAAADSVERQAGAAERTLQAIAPRLAALKVG
jgi:3-deoxy-D-manno-octulosonic-acid transferase